MTEPVIRAIDLARDRAAPEKVDGSIYDPSVVPGETAMYFSRDI